MEGNKMKGKKGKLKHETSFIQITNKKRREIKRNELGRKPHLHFDEKKSL